jgi:hypothetical protein
MKLHNINIMPAVAFISSSVRRFVLPVLAGILLSFGCATEPRDRSQPLVHSASIAQFHPITRGRRTPRAFGVRCASRGGVCGWYGCHRWMRIVFVTSRVTSEQRRRVAGFASAEPSRARVHTAESKHHRVVHRLNHGVNGDVCTG